MKLAGVLFAGTAALLSAVPADAAHWIVDREKSRLGFSVQWSGEPFNAEFKSWTADIDFDPADPARSHASVTIDLSSEASDEPDFDDGLKGAQGFQVTQFPKALFVTDRIARKSADRYVAQGTLSLHGVKRPVTLPFTLSIDGGVAHMHGEAEVLRTDFGLGTGMWAGEDPVAHRVVITVDLQARRAP